MLLLVLGIVVFLGMHSVQLFAPNVRTQFIEKRGEGPWKGLYSVISLIGFVALIYGYGAARVSDANMYFWTLPSWFSHVVMLFMLPAFILLISSQLPAGRIKKAVKNPMVIGVKTWAFFHLLQNGDLASLILFATFLVWAVLLVIDYKKREQTFPENPSAKFDVIAVVVGTGLWLAFILWLHDWLIGVPVIA